MTRDSCIVAIDKLFGINYASTIAETTKKLEPYKKGPLYSIQAHSKEIFEEIKQGSINLTLDSLDDDDDDDLVIA